MIQYLSKKLFTFLFTAIGSVCTEFTWLCHLSKVFFPFFGLSLFDKKNVSAGGYNNNDDDNGTGDDIGGVNVLFNYNINLELPSESYPNEWRMIVQLINIKQTWRHFTRMKRIII